MAYPLLSLLISYKYFNLMYIAFSIIYSVKVILVV